MSLSFRSYTFFSASYMFKSTERTALQEIGPRFTLKLRSLKTGLPSNNPLGAPMKPLELAKEEEEPDQQYAHIAEEGNGEEVDNDEEVEETEERPEEEKKEGKKDGKKEARKGEEFAWAWNVSLHLRKTCLISVMTSFCLQPRMDFKKRNFYL